MLLLLNYILTDDFSIRYVFLNSQREMEVWLKFCALWSGKEGSLLFWNFANLLLASIFVSHGAKDTNKAKAMAILTAFASTLLILNIFVNPFEQATRHFNGVGMNPILRTPEMVFHPPIVFLGYAAVAILYSSCLAGIQSRGIARTAWILLTIGIVLGGFWAYRTLGWGGFWGWDPVENSSLLPWLAVTAYFHTKRGKEFFAYLSLIFVVFTAFVTRSGVLSSVHSFGEDPLGFTYLLMIFALAIPIVKRWKIEDQCYTSVIFSAMILVVLLGTIANLFRNVDRNYYLITFVPVFLISVLLILYRIKESKRKIIHLGVVLLFLGATSVWFFEQKELVTLNPENKAFGVELLYWDSETFSDAEKFVLRVKILSNVGVFEPEIQFYDNWGQVRKVSIVSTPFLDYYLALVSIEENSAKVEFYVVPMISLVWLGSALMVLGSILRFRK
ncbi:MAG: cytochrome c biogenesis protein CcsA [Archaeoglobaceae archaeon]